MVNKKLILFVVLMAIGVHVKAQDTLSSFYPNSDQRWDKVYIGQQKVHETIYHKNDTPWMTANYNEENRQDWKWFHDNGNPYFEATIVDDLLQGPYKIWYENGQLAESIEFEDNLENGKAIFYYPGGQVAMKGSYKNGEMVGKWLFFQPDGTKANGLWVWKFAASTTVTRMKGYLVNGKAIGNWTYKSTANQGRPDQIIFNTGFAEEE